MLTAFVILPVLFNFCLGYLRKGARTLHNNLMQVSLKFDDFYLPNGLRVILHEDHSTPIVAVNLWYHVGSKNESSGRTGFAHLFEHLMFEGSLHHDREYFAPLQEAGANVNGSTNTDRTNYYEVVPSNFLELALWLESDRMGYLLDAMTPEKLDNQREVVKNEKRQRYDNVPYGLVGEQIAEQMYPPAHPYSWLTIGSMADLTAASLDDVKNFFRVFYVPNNASLVVAGDFDSAEARQLIEKYFATLPAGAEIVRPNPPAPHLEKAIRSEMPDVVALPRVYLSWHTVPEYHEDEAALDFLASILSSGRGSRLQQKLIFNQQIAQDVYASHFCREIAGQFQIVSTSKPNTAPAEIEKVIQAEIEQIKLELPSPEEMERALNTREAAYIYSLQTVLGKADQLNNYATMRGNPNFFEQDLERFRQVTPADVQRVANEYLTDNKLALTVLPKDIRDATAPTTGLISNGTGSIAETKQVGNNKHQLVHNENLGGLFVPPPPKPDPKLVLPEINRRFLSNGLEVLLVRRGQLPLVSLNLIFKTGAAANPLEKFGLSSMTAGLLNQGTKTRSAIEISNELQKIGAQLGTGAGWDSASVSLLTLTKNLERGLDIFADVAINPVFPEPELETQRRRLLVALLQQKDNPNAVAANAYNRLLYGKNHPYGNSLVGDEETLGELSREDLQNFYQTFYRPNNAALIVVGDVEPEAILARLENALAGWQPAEILQVVLPDAPPREKSAIYLIDKPGSAQSVITIGQIGVERRTPDYFALQVMNSLLGGQFTSRINMNLREDKGYTYGARTGFEYRQGAAPFAAATSVNSSVTREAISEILKELNEIRSSRPITETELEYNKQSLVRRYPANFETAGQISGQLAGVVIYDLPDSYFNDYAANIAGVTVADANRVAQKYLETEKMAILVVGDRQTIEPKLREIRNIELNFLNTEGELVNS